MNSIRLDKRDLILAKGAAVMTRRGYHGTGVQEIVQAAGIPKGSFYHYFASKEDFALQALAFIYQPRLQRYAEALSNPALSPRAQQAGELAADEDCANLAAFIANAWQGVLTRLKVGSQTQPMEAFVQRLERLLKA